MQPEATPEAVEVFEEPTDAPDKDSPGPPLVAVLAAIALALKRRAA